MNRLVIILVNVLFFQIPALIKGQATSNIYQFKCKTLEGKDFDFNDLKGKKILIVNTASECGLTPQFKQLEELFEKYKSKNFTIVGFPSNDFASQDPGSNAEIKTFCERNYGVTFLMMEKISVKGKNIHPVYNWLCHKKENGVFSSKVRWNFQKYLIDENGHLEDVVAPWKKPNCKKIIKWVEK